jgi:TPR repeat protein
MNEHYQINLITAVYSRLKVILALLVVSALLPGNLAQADFVKGLNAYENKDYATALMEWMPLADAGDSQAQYNLGWMYKRGRAICGRVPNSNISVIKASAWHMVTALLLINWQV